MVPFDLQELVKRAEDAGLPALKKVSHDELEVILDWLRDSCLAEAGSAGALAWLAVVAPGIELLKPVVLASLDKAEGSV